MSQIIDPNTGRTLEQARLLASLMNWSTDPQILQCMFDQRLADPKHIVNCAHRIQATTSGEPKEWILAPTEVAVIAYQFLRHRSVRRVIAKQTYKYGRASLPPRITAGEILRDLTDLSSHLVREYRLEHHEERAQMAQAAAKAGLVLPSAI